MSKKSCSARVRQVASSLALCTVAVASQAEPISLTGTCHLTSILAGQGTCEIFYQLTDNFSSPSNARLGQVKVDGITVGQFVNDSVDPIDFAIAQVAGRVAVACGVSHTVTAYVAPLGAGTPYEKVGHLPAIKCPVAP